MAEGRAHGVARRPRLLMYAMVDPAGQDSAPKVRIAMLGAALEAIAEVERVGGGRTRRAREGWRWLQRGGFDRVDAVYVETSTTTASPFDLGFLALARLRGRAVGIYFRDAHQLFRDVFPRRRARQWFGDAAWRFTMPFLRVLATVRFAPSTGLAGVLGLADPVLLPPGTDPSSPNLGVPASNLVTAIVAPTAAAGFELLRAALEIVRRDQPSARLRIITSVEPNSPLPSWIEAVKGSRADLPELLRDARVCVIPLPQTRYVDLAVPVRLADLTAFGKPLVVTSSEATRAFLGSSAAAAVVDATPAALAEAIAPILADDALASRMGARSRAFAEEPSSTWAHRATTLVGALLERSGPTR